jgi:hypothetical protein
MKPNEQHPLLKWINFSDEQLSMPHQAARCLPVGARDGFLQTVAKALSTMPTEDVSQLTDAELQAALHLALDAKETIQ